jgi:hypothetical protein
MLAMIAAYIKENKKQHFGSVKTFTGEYSFVEFVKFEIRDSSRWLLAIHAKRNQQE